uniref:Plastocyanin-like domain-containing protein n=1 Tax=Corethron hystrix TaxID=216773 RepID=A0A7S1BK18_9STRA|mmetsp:Transcript_31545/g.72212  ORF Transcript_31545/g.72212 Transcript_31545/m.72212 type:complete len:885 (+) Transcript_31545:88-2742(+)
MHIYASLFVLSSTVLFVQAEQTPEELQWSKEACNDSGYQDQFDYCATLEFCEGDGGAFMSSGVDDLGFFGYDGLGYNYGDDKNYGNDDRGYGYDDKNYGYDDGQNYGNETDQYSSYGNDNDINTSYSSGMDMPNTVETANVSKKTLSEGNYGWRIGGSSTCFTPGPTIRMSRGSRYGIFLRNSATEATNLHTHGLHVQGHGNADDVTRSVSPGDTAIYNITIPKYHMGGTYFYHSHHHGSARKQVGGGAYGMLIVDDGNDLGTTDTNVIDFLNNERLLILDNVRGADQISANGFGQETFIFNDSEWYRMRILFVNTDQYVSGAYMNFKDGEGDSSVKCDVHAIAHDGIFRFRVPAKKSETNQFYLSSSTRLDIAIKCQGEGSSDVEVDGQWVATIKMQDPSVISEISASKPNATPFVDGIHEWNSKRPSYLRDLLSLTPHDIMTLDVYETSINEISYNKDTPLCNQRGKDFTYGTVNEWTVTGTKSGHPLHVHMYPMQIASNGCGEEHDIGEFYDTVEVMNGFGVESSEECKVRLHFINIAGHTLMHCHILQHGDQGAMAFFNVVGGPIQPSKPRVLQCADGSINGCDIEQKLANCIPYNEDDENQYYGDDMMNSNMNSKSDMTENYYQDDITLPETIISEELSEDDIFDMNLIGKENDIDPSSSTITEIISPSDKTVLEKADTKIESEINESMNTSKTISPSKNIPIINTGTKIEETQVKNEMNLTNISYEKDASEKLGDLVEVSTIENSTINISKEEQSQKVDSNNSFPTLNLDDRENITSEGVKSEHKSIDNEANSNTNEVDVSSKQTEAIYVSNAEEAQSSSFVTIAVTSAIIAVVTVIFAILYVYKRRNKSLKDLKNINPSEISCDNTHDEENLKDLIL